MVHILMLRWMPLIPLISLNKGWKCRVKTYILHSPSIPKHVLGVQNRTGTLQQKTWFIKKPSSFFFDPFPYQGGNNLIQNLKGRKSLRFLPMNSSICICSHFCTQTQLQAANQTGTRVMGHTSLRPSICNWTSENCKIKW